MGNIHNYEANTSTDIDSCGECGGRCPSTNALLDNARSHDDMQAARQIDIAISRKTIKSIMKVAALAEMTAIMMS